MKIKQIEWQVWNGDPHRWNAGIECDDGPLCLIGEVVKRDRKSTRLNSSH